MGKVITNLSMSLDGFIAGLYDDVRQVFAWYYSGETAFTMSGSDRSFKVSKASAAWLESSTAKVGAVIYGRKTFDLTKGWGGHPPVGVPCFIVTHQIPENWNYKGSPFIFVTDGIKSAIEQAQAVAGDANVSIGTATITQQCLELGLLDELQLDLAHVLLGKGVKLFEPSGIEPIDLKKIKVVEGTGVTHLHFQVNKN
jgi:dihydrofolate reductase